MSRSLLTGLAGLLMSALTVFALPRSTPEAQGISSRALLDFIQAADQEGHGLHSFMLVRHGQVVTEGWWAPYGAESPHQLYSLSKSFTSTAIGMLVAEGRLSVHDLVLPFFPEYAPEEPGDNLKGMRVRDLLIMASGHETEPSLWSASEPWAKVFLHHPVPHWPGTRFRYNTPATYMLSAILQKVTGETLIDYLRPRLFAPLEMVNPTWDTNPEGHSVGGSGLNLRTEDIAKFGQLYLREGRWQDRQLLPASWIREATTLQTSNGSSPDSDWQQGYGYQFWRCRHGLYRGDGAFGQFCIVLPEQDAVIAITAGSGDMQAIMNLLWKHLLPALRPAPLPADEAAHARLTTALAALALPAQAGAATTPRATEIAGRRYTFPENDQGLVALALTPNADGSVTLHLDAGTGEQTITCRPGTWTKTRLAYLNRPEQPVAVSGAWTEADTYTFQLCVYETPYTFTVALQFDGDEVRHTGEYNVSFGPRERAPLTGRRTVAE